MEWIHHGHIYQIFKVISQSGKERSNGVKLGGIEAEAGACVDRSLCVCEEEGKQGGRTVPGSNPALAIKIQGTPGTTHGSSLEISVIPFRFPSCGRERRTQGARAQLYSHPRGATAHEAN